MTIRRRKFPPKVYKEIIDRQGGLCACGCNEPLGSDPRDINFDHQRPLWNDGEDTPENLRALKVRHHLSKTRKEAKERAKGKRIQNRHGLRKRKMNQSDKALAKMLGGGDG